ncbi:hypothetical protein UCRPC4_g04033 [Phaeomoniella chlamydospora]|uniref:Vps72/YL1 C-terminal domain-containing protein n=1 Tax=Phaeomoniella chlamydospora TaxID=158046 RepID=A0A0G2EDB0_PHACM|nr:hypothetical protein UCRPC4_g04033 [Phaeomoniella chlamydospora]
MAGEEEQVDMEMMESDSSGSDSDNDSTSSEPVETLVSGRAKRATAGNRMANLIEREDDDEVALLFAEAEDDEDVEFEGEGADDWDVQMESSSDEDDQGPNAAGDDDLEGEKEIQRQAKAERAKKRKAQEALTKLPAIRKKVTIDPNAQTQSGTPAPRPKKKSERVSWLPEANEAPVRASSRKQTMANKEVTHKKLKDQEVKRRQLLAQMQVAERIRAKSKPKKLTQADRLAEASRVEKKNAKSLNRWETMEKKRAEEQAARLAALHNRKLEGPVLTFWSGKAEWVGDKLVKVGSEEVHQKAPREYGGEKRGRKRKQADLDPNTTGLAKEHEATTPVVQESGAEGVPSGQVEALQPTAETIVPPGPEKISTTADGLDSEDAKDGDEMETDKSADRIEQPQSSEQSKQLETVPKAQPTIESQQPESTHTAQPPEDKEKPSKVLGSFLDGIHEYALLDTTVSPAIKSTTDMEPSTRADQTTLADTTLEPTPMATATVPEKPEGTHSVATSNPDIPAQQQLQTDGKTPPEAHTPDLESTAATQPALPATETSTPSTPTPTSLITELPMEPSTPPPPPPPTYSTRNLIKLVDFNSVTPDIFPALSLLTKTTTLPKEKPIPATTTAPVAAAALGPKLTKAQQRALSSLPVLCYITSKPARYRDPETGIPYANAYAYKKIQEAKKSGNLVWSGMLGTYVGKEGEVARGVPRGFLRDEPLEPDPQAQSESGTDAAKLTSATVTTPTQAPPNTTGTTLSTLGPSDKPNGIELKKVDEDVATAKATTSTTTPTPLTAAP